MRQWFIALAGGGVLAVAIAVGVVVFASGSSSPDCDRDVLAQGVQRGIDDALGTGAEQFNVAMPEGCDDEDLTLAVRETTREWHAMPGGIVMQAEEHAP